jgi:hypothetical protein
MKERKTVSGVEKHSAWLHFTSVDSAIFCRPLVHIRSFRRDGPCPTRRLFDGVAGMQPLDALSEGDGKFLLHKHGLQ